VSRAERAKGVRGEREVRELLERHAFEVRGLEASGDYLAIHPGVTLHVETKRQEVARPWLWWEQASTEAPAGTTPIVAFRRSRSPWLALANLEELARVIDDVHFRGIATR
jgi:Holliday junction resolvase